MLHNIRIALAAIIMAVAVVSTVDRAVALTARSLLPEVRLPRKRVSLRPSLLAATARQIFRLTKVEVDPIGRTTEPGLLVGFLAVPIS
jgi:hypothetical protein